jgi:flagellar hook-associated protein 2
MPINAVGSGIDIPTLVSQLVSAERTPAQSRINTAGAAATAKLTAIGQIKSSMTNLQSALTALSTAADKQGYKATVASDAGFTATAGSNAMPGNYSVEVARLATAQKIASSAHTADERLGTGTLTLSYGDGKTVPVEITSSATLTDIAAAINKATGGSGVTAGVITASDGQHLVLNAVDTGSDGAFTVAVSGGDGGLASLAYAGSGSSDGGMTQVVAAQNALVRVDGFERESSSNTVANLVPGVTLALTKATAGKTTTLGLAADNSAVTSALTAFVTAYNAANTTLRNVSAFDTTAQTSSALTGDSLVRTLQQQLRSQVTANVTELTELGITIDKAGVMSFDSSTFNTAISERPGATAALLGKQGGFTKELTTLLSSQLDTTDGTLAQRSNSLNTQIKGYEQQLDDLDTRMEQIRARYTAQFTAMETMITQMQSSASSLNQLLSS